MADQQKLVELRCAIIPLENGNLLLPNAVVREMMGHNPPDPLADVPSWLLGEMLWRERTIPLLSFEAFCGQPYHGYGERKRVMVCGGLKGNDGIPFYAVTASGIPRLATLDKSKVKLGRGEFADHEAILCQVEVLAQNAVIPDLDLVERKLAEVWTPPKNSA